MPVWQRDLAGCSRHRWQQYFCDGSGVSGYVEYDALLPALIASYTASTTSHLLGLEKFAVDVQEIWQIGNIKM